MEVKFLYINIRNSLLLIDIRMVLPMESTILQAQQQAKKTIEEYKFSAKERIEKARGVVSRIIEYSTDVVRAYINRSPLAAAFLFILLALSTIPLSVFVVFALSSTAFTLSCAVVGFSMFEGTCLMIGAGVLLFVLAGIAVLTTLAFLWGYGMYLTYYAGSPIILIIFRFQNFYLFT